MSETTGRVIKKDTVRMTEGPRRIAEPAERGPPSSAPAVRIVEQSETAVVIEVTCACGEKTCVQCDYVPDPDTG